MQPFPFPRHLESQKNWLSNTGCISEDEIAYLTPKDPWDLRNIAPSKERDMPFLYPAMEKIIYVSLRTAKQVCVYVTPWSPISNIRKRSFSEGLSPKPQRSQLIYRTLLFGR